MRLSATDVVPIRDPLIAGPGPAPHRSMLCRKAQTGIRAAVMAAIEASHTATIEVKLTAIRKIALGVPVSAAIRDVGQEELRQIPRTRGVLRPVRVGVGPMAARKVGASTLPRIATPNAVRALRVHAPAAP